MIGGYNSMRKVFFLFGLLILIVSVVNANAALTERNVWTGNYGISSDGWGGTDNSGIISAEVPSGAIVEAAYLYSTSCFTQNFANVTLQGNNIALTDIGQTGSFLWSAMGNVTSIVKSVIDGGAGGIYNFNITDHDDNNGEALVVVYSLASLPKATVAIMDGAQQFSGDTFNLNFADPIDPSNPDFFAEMTLGIQHSCADQQSNVTVNGSVLSNNAGNFDDGENFDDGSLITVGGIGDDTLNTNTYDGDDERYSLVPFIALGDKTISVFTENPSNDDQIFLATFHLSGTAAVNKPVNPVPEPGTILLLIFGITGLVGLKRMKG